MKLASLRNGRPDGQLVVVSRDLSACVSAGRVAAGLQAALDQWDQVAPQLAELSTRLNNGDIGSVPFDVSLCVAPLPRAYQWIDGACYLTHLNRVRSLKGSKDAQLRPDKLLLYQGGSDSLSGPHDPIRVGNEDLAIDFEAEVAVISGPVPMGCSKAQASEAIRLVTFCNDVSLRRLVADDLENGFGFFHSKPSTSFAPIAATPDEFGAAWANDKLDLRIRARVNETLIGQPNAATNMAFDFADLIVTAAATRDLGCGTILGGGTVANEHDEALPIKRDGIGFACITEARTAEKAKYGRARTPFLKFGDRVRIGVLDTHDQMPLGMIDQVVRAT